MTVCNNVIRLASIDFVIVEKAGRFLAKFGRSRYDVKPSQQARNCSGWKPGKKIKHEWETRVASN